VKQIFTFGELNISREIWMRIKKGTEYSVPSYKKVLAYQSTTSSVAGAGFVQVPLCFLAACFFSIAAILAFMAASLSALVVDMVPAPETVSSSCWFRERIVFSGNTVE
jgi:hypothetical protein